MEIIQLICAISLSWLLGIVWLQPVRSIPSGPGFWPMLLGYGYVSGICATTLIMRLIDALRLSQNINLIAAFVALLAFSGIWLLQRNNVISSNDSQSFKPHLLPLWQKFLFIFFLLLILFRFFSIGLEVVLRPLFPWDAWTTWAVKPHVWFAYKELVAFVDASQWLSDKQSLHYTIDAWHYPGTVSLIQLWTALAYGRWNEIINNISWILCVVALALGFYGQARQYGTDPLKSIIFTYFLLSVPLLNTHVALAGYADLWMATVFSFAAIAFWQWLKTKNSRQGFIAVGLGIMLPLIKTEGMVWLLTLTPAFFMYFCSRTMLIIFFCFLLILCWVFFYTGGIYFELPLIGEFSLTSNSIDIPYLGHFAFVPEANIFAFTDNLLLFDNWHLFWYLVPVLVFFALRSILSDRLLFTYTITVFSGLAVLLIVFSMTGAKEWAESKTSINRIFLHIVPLLSFYLLILFQSLTAKRSDTIPQSALQPV